MNRQKRDTTENVENTMDEVCEQRGRIKENEKEKYVRRMRQRQLH